MASFKHSLTPELIQFIEVQPLYFTASAAPKTRINLSPKGIDTFRVIDPNLVGYLDLTGSGNETAAHILMDGRLTIMFCSFGEKPLILRLYGQGRVIRPDQDEWSKWSNRFPHYPGERQIILLQIESLQTSCGFGVPRLETIAQRTLLIDWAAQKGPEAVAEYQRKKNSSSIDGLPTSVRQ
jgi:hypothetical protein